MKAMQSILVGCMLLAYNPERHQSTVSLCPGSPFAAPTPITRTWPYTPHDMSTQDAPH